MHAMLLDAPRRPLRAAELPDPEPSSGQVLIRVHACAVCRTDLHVVDGELTQPKLPLIPGHEIVGTIAALGEDTTASPSATGRRPWLGWTCGVCQYCRSGRENLCGQARFTGYQIDGGYASTPSPTSASASRSPPTTATRKRRRCSAPASSAIAALRMAGDARAARPLRLRRGGAHHRPGRTPAGPRSLRVHPARRHRGAVIRARARRGTGPAAPTNRRRSSSTRRSSSRRSVRWYRGAARQSSKRRHAWYAPAST